MLTVVDLPVLVSSVGGFPGGMGDFPPAYFLAYAWQVDNTFIIAQRFGGGLKGWVFQPGASPILRDGITEGCMVPGTSSSMVNAESQFVSMSGDSINVTLDLTANKFGCYEPVFP